MIPTLLLYSSHNRSNTIHNDWIAQRALKGNRKILFIPFSEMPTEQGDPWASQVQSWNNFAWFFDFYRPYQLQAWPFYWSQELKPHDVHLLMHQLLHAEVVILGGADPSLGLLRYRQVSQDFYQNAQRFEAILRERMLQGRLTVGYSAGVDQLSHWMSSSLLKHHPVKGFGLARKIIALSHIDFNQVPLLKDWASHYPQCLVFGLPNDSALAIAESQTPGHRSCQVIHFILDYSWDNPNDHWHIKTRQGMKIDHFYADGRHWAFNHGDQLIRFFDPNHHRSECFILKNNGSIWSYDRQEPTQYHSFRELFFRR